jgi:hypothetical protein
MIILVLQTGILLFTGILYCRPVKTFEMQNIPNIVIFFASRTSSIISGLYFFYMAVFSLLLAINLSSLSKFSYIFYVQLFIVNGLYGLAWLYHYIFIKKSSKILVLLLLNLISIILSFVFIYLKKKNGTELLNFSIPYLFNRTTESVMLLICMLLLIPLILWHFYAPFAMN